MNDLVFNLVSKLEFNYPLEYLSDISSDAVSDVLPHSHLKKIIHEILFF